MRKLNKIPSVIGYGLLLFILTHILIFFIVLCLGMMCFAYSLGGAGILAVFGYCLYLSYNFVYEKDHWFSNWAIKQKQNKDD